MAKVTCSSVRVERKPKAYMNTDTGNIAFPLGHFRSASIVIFKADSELIITETSYKWEDLADKPNWIPVYDGDTIKIAFGESDES